MKKSENARRAPTASKVLAKRKPHSSDKVLDLSGAPDRNAAENKTLSILSEAGHRQKLVGIAQALREEGVDERAVAKAIVVLLENLLCNEKPTGREKLLGDLLKEVTRLLEPPGSAGANDPGENPLQIRLIHNIPRPWQTLEGDGADDDRDNSREIV